MIKSTEELAKIAAVSAARALKEHGIDAKHIVAGSGAVAHGIDKHWIGIWIEDNPKIAATLSKGHIHGPIWIGIVAPDINQGMLTGVKDELKKAGFGH